MAERQQALAEAILKDPDVGEPVLVHRRRRHQPDAEHRPVPDQPEAAGRARGARRPRSSAGCSGDGAACRASRSTAAGAGSDHRRQRSAARSTSSCWRTPIRRSSTLWVPRLVERLRPAAGARRCRQRLQRRTGWRSIIAIDRGTAARFGITPATVDNALYDAFGQRIVSTIYTQSNQYRVILEADPGAADLAAVARSRSICRRRPPATGRCRCRRSPRSASGPAPLLITHLGQFPATTISFNLAPGASLGAGGRGDRDARRRRSACRAASSPASRARRWRSRPRWPTRSC